MATISQIKVGDLTYDICDEASRNYLFPLTQEAGVLKHGTQLKLESKSYIQGATSASLMANKTVLNADSWDPVLGIQTKGGGSWTIGNYNGEELRFVYFSAERIAGGTNNPNLDITINENGITNLKNNIYYSSETSRTKNTVLAAPNGSNGAAQFRALVEADIPSLNASKITAGTLPLGRGGTGATTKINAFKALGSWTSVATTSGTTAKSFTSVSTTGYQEILVVVSYSGTVGSTDYKSSMLIPVVQLSSGGDDYYFGGGWWTNSYGAAANISLTKITPYQGKVNGSSVNMSWAIYGR